MVESQNIEWKESMGSHRSRPYNPLIANIFFQTGGIEAWGADAILMRILKVIRDNPTVSQSQNVSCIIQINTEDSWVSDSPYLHAFDGLEQVHHQMEEHALERVMRALDFRVIKTLEHMLPNGKKLVQMDFGHGY